MNIFKNILSKKDDENLESDKYKIFYNLENNESIVAVRFYEDFIPEPYLNYGYNHIVKLEIKNKRGVWKLLYHNEEGCREGCMSDDVPEYWDETKKCNNNISKKEIKLIHDLIKNNSQALKTFVKYLYFANVDLDLIKEIRGDSLGSEKSNITESDSNISKVKTNLDNLKNNDNNIKIFEVQQIEGSPISEVGILSKSEEMAPDGKNDITKLAIKTKDGKWKLLYHHEKGWSEDYRGSSYSWDETKHCQSQRSILSFVEVGMILSAVKEDVDALEIIKKYLEDVSIIKGPNPEQNEFSSLVNNDVEEEIKKR